MPRLDYATQKQLTNLLQQSGLSENTPSSNAFAVLAHSPAVGASALRLVLGFLTRTALEPDLRELIILRVVERCRGRYAWTQHVEIARTVGVNDLQIMALETGETPLALFTDRERTAFAFADEVLDSSRCTDTTFVAVQQDFSSRQIVELLLLIGSFRTISGLMTHLDVEVEAPFGVDILEQAGTAEHWHRSESEGADNRVLPCSA